MRNVLLFLIVALLGMHSTRPAVAADYFVYVSGNSTTIECYQFNPAATTIGTMLSAKVTKTVGSSSGYMAWSPDRTRMYTLGAANQVAAYSINSTTGALTALGTVATWTPTLATDDGATHLCVHPSGKTVYVANYSAGTIRVIPVNTDGSLGTPSAAVAAGVKAHMVRTNLAGTYLYVPCLGDDHVAIFPLDAVDGHLTSTTPTTVEITNNTALPSLPGPRHLDFNGDETRAYVINELESSMTTFTHNPSTGALTNEIVSKTTLPTGFSSANTCAHVLVSNDDRTLYGSNRGHDSIVSYRIGTDGNLTLLGHITNGDPAGLAGTSDDVVIRHPRDFALDPTGTVLLVANRDTNNVAVFRVTPSTGGLAYLGVIAVPAGPTFVGVMRNKSTLTSVSVTPATKTLTISSSQDFDVHGLDQFGLVMPVSPTVNWTVTGLGTIDAAGIFTATAPGTATITATTVVGSLTDTATVTITAAGGGAAAGSSSGGGGGGCGLGAGIGALLLSVLLLLRATHVIAWSSKP